MNLPISPRSSHTIFCRDASALFVRIQKIIQVYSLVFTVSATGTKMPPHPVKIRYNSELRGYPLRHPSDEHTSISYQNKAGLAYRSLYPHGYQLFKGEIYLEERPCFQGKRTSAYEKLSFGAKQGGAESFRSTCWKEWIKNVNS